jgi:hypothetical protein
MNPELSSAALTLDTYERIAIPDRFIGTFCDTVSMATGTLVWWCRLDYDLTWHWRGFPHV